MAEFKENIRRRSGSIVLSDILLVKVSGYQSYACAVFHPIKGFRHKMKSRKKMHGAAFFGISEYSGPFPNSELSNLSLPIIASSLNMMTFHATSPDYFSINPFTECEASNRINTSVVNTVLDVNYPIAHCHQLTTTYISTCTPTHSSPSSSIPKYENYPFWI